MDMILNIVSWAFIIGGGIFCLIGGLGLIRLPDMFARMHGASLIDTMGIGLILTGLMFQAGFTLITGKLLLILVLCRYQVLGMLLRPFLSVSSIA